MTLLSLDGRGRVGGATSSGERSLVTNCHDARDSHLSSSENFSLNLATEIVTRTVASPHESS